LKKIRQTFPFCSPTDFLIFIFRAFTRKNTLKKFDQKFEKNSNLNSIFIILMIIQDILHHRKIIRIAREYPTLLFIISITIMFFGNKKEGIILFLAFLTSEVLNKILKTCCRNVMGTKNYPIIGRGIRPPVAVFELPQDGKMYKTSIQSYGMPSGHSQLATLFSTYIILRTYNNSALTLQHKLLIYALMLFLAYYVIYSRIKEYWHTIQQTVIGGTIGIILGFFTYKTYNIYK
tara:strand:+ start:236 stop:934 length:699 start_codon:yes stop_codon:yes gene_type:complete